MSKMLDSDWKAFRQIKEVAVERFNQQSLFEYREILDDESKPALDRHTLIHRISDNRNRHFNLLFKGGDSRSKVVMQLLGFRGEKLVDEDMLSQLSEELLERSDPELVGWNKR